MVQVLHTFPAPRNRVGFSLIGDDLVMMYQGNDDQWRVSFGFSHWTVEEIQRLGGYEATLTLLREQRKATPELQEEEGRSVYINALAFCNEKLAADVIEPLHVFGAQQDHALGRFQGIVPLVRTKAGEWKRSDKLVPHAHIDEIIRLGGYGACHQMLEDLNAKAAKTYPPLPEVSGQSFEDDILPKNSRVLADMFNEKCVPCKWLLPELEALQAEEGAALKVVKVDTDKLLQAGDGFLAQVLEKNGIRSVPTLMLFEDGVFKGHLCGAPQSKGQIKQWIRKVSGPGTK